VSHFAASPPRTVSSGKAISSRAARILVLVLLVCLLVVSLIAWIGNRSGGDSRPYIRNLKLAPAASQALIVSIAKRNDGQCHDRIIGTSNGAGTKITTKNVRDFDYVGVAQVSADGRELLLTVVCVFGAADRLTRSTGGWSELGPRQLEPSLSQPVQ
jgi:hypothetical protein